MADSVYSAQDLDYITTYAYARLACAVVLSYDAGLTFAAEIQRIWKRKFTCASLCYLSIRYSTPLFYVLSITGLLLSYPSGSTCAGIIRVEDVMFILRTVAIALVVILRIYALSGRSWTLALLITPVALYSPVYQILYEFDEVTDAIPAVAQFACSYDAVKYASLDGVIDSGWIAPEVTSLASEVFLVLLTWYKTISIKYYARGSDVKTPLATLLLRDGSLYFLFLIGFETVILATDAAAGVETSPVALVVGNCSDCLSVILISRFLLNLRGLGLADSTGAGSATEKTSLFFQRFDTYAVGTLGATVRTNSIPEEGPANLEDPWREDEEEEDPVFCQDPFREGMTGSVNAATDDTNGGAEAA